MSEREIIVTDHALVRYLERVQGFDLEPVRQAILAIARKAGASANSISFGGFTYALKEGRVTTIIPGTSGQSSRLKSERHNGTAIRVQKDAR